jgi:hypothetical protein
MLFEFLPRAAGEDLHVAGEDDEVDAQLVDDT